MHRVQTISFSVLINGKPTDTFKPLRGLRHGDPLPPYLFILCAEGLTSIIKTAESQGVWNGIRMSHQGLVIRLLLFADDNILFAKLDD